MGERWLRGGAAGVTAAMAGVPGFLAAPAPESGDSGLRASGLRVDIVVKSGFSSVGAAISADKDRVATDLATGWEPVRAGTAEAAARLSVACDSRSPPGGAGSLVLAGTAFLAAAGFLAGAARPSVAGIFAAGLLGATRFAKVLLTGGSWGLGRCSSCSGRLSCCTGHGLDDPPAHPAKAGTQKRRAEPLPVWARGL